MERKEIIRHDGDSITMEGEITPKRYLNHHFDHQKGKGEDEAHKCTYDHESMHNIEHNESPINEGVTRYGSYIDKSEEATGVVSPTHKMPYKRGERIGQGAVARPWTGARPWRGEE